MPELPEVETVANGVNERVRGQRIDSVWLSARPQTFKTPAAEMEELLSGSRIERVRRIGKHIVFDLNRPNTDQGAFDLQWIVHLGMTGRLLVCAADVPLPPHSHAVLGLSGGRELRFVDPRRFGRLAVHLLTPASNENEVAVGGFEGPGLEPLAIPLEQFVALFRGRRLAIKAALLNQKLLHGVGNIYADESLFRAGIRPKRMAGRLRRVELERLYTALQSVLREAISLGGSSVSDYVDADGIRGFFQLQHRVYMRTGKPCLVCGTPIRKLVIGGRSSHFCPQCQK